MYTIILVKCSRSPPWVTIVIFRVPCIYACKLVDRKNFRENGQKGMVSSEQKRVMLVMDLVLKLSKRHDLVWEIFALMCLKSDECSWLDEHGNFDL